MRILITIIILGITVSCMDKSENYLITVNGPRPSSSVDFILEHEHLLVDFSGAQGYDPSKWNHDSVENRVLPYLMEIDSLGADLLIDATPQYLGRDVKLLKRLSGASGIEIMTNTGLYGAVERKFLPEYAYSESAEELAGRWIKEFDEGIDQTDIKPGFIKISVNPGSLGDVERKLVEAACITHKATGLTIASHTGPAIPAFEELEVLDQNGILPSAFVWIHAQNETNWEKCVEAAQMGAWVAFDGLNDENVEEYLERITFMKEKQLLNRILISHDAGWYDPAKTGGGTFRPFNTVFLKLIPLLKENGFSRNEIQTIFRSNPIEAFAVRKRVKK